MSDSQNELVLALLATLEAQAKRKGRKSVVKGVVSRLVEAGAAEDLVNQVRALGGGAPPRVAPKNGAKPRGKAKAPEVSPLA